MDEIADTLAAEMDYLREARNLEYFARFFKGEKLAHIPRIYRFMFALVGSALITAIALIIVAFLIGE